MNEMVYISFLEKRISMSGCAKNKDDSDEVGIFDYKRRGSQRGL